LFVVRLLHPLGAEMRFFVLKVTPSEFQSVVEANWVNTRHRAVMGWGPPGASKTAIIRNVAEKFNVRLIDFRLGQLTPQDLKGIPVPVDGVTHFFPPAELPRGGEGILLLDEFVQAVPTMQGIAQELLLSRRMGEYRVPDGWMVVALGNRKEDRASVYEMPAQVGNRFKHYLIEPTLDDFRKWAYASGRIHEQILAFLQWRPELLHKFDRNTPAWPSPRSWEFASEDHATGGSVIPSVGEGAGLEFDAFCRAYTDLPDLQAILEGKGERLAEKREQSTMFALVVGLALRAERPTQAVNAFKWIAANASEEWCQLYITQSFDRARTLGKLGAFLEAFSRNPDALAFVQRLNKLMVE
jgi:MoxR-like ATPase